MKSTQMLQGVMKTAQEALDCKNSAFASRLVVRKTPLLNRVYQARSCLITKAVEASVSASTPGKLNMQLLVLGAGLDTTYLTCADKVYLVDYQDVLDRHTNLPAHVTLVPGDLVEKEQLLAALSSSKFNFSAHTVVLVECVLGYINSEAAARMLRSITKAIPVSMIITYDPVLAYTDVVGDGFSAKMHCKFAERDAPLLGCAQSVQEYSARFTTAGYAHVNACTIYQALQLYLSREERATSVTLEPFDEFASLALLHRHYALCIGSTNSGWYQRTMACLTRQDSCNNAEDRHRRLNSRLACAELRLHSLVLRREAGNTRYRSFANRKL